MDLTKLNAFKIVEYDIFIIKSLFRIGTYFFLIINHFFLYT